MSRAAQLLLSLLFVFLRSDFFFIPMASVMSAGYEPLFFLALYILLYLKIREIHVMVIFCILKYAAGKANIFGFWLFSDSQVILICILAIMTDY